MLGNDSDNDKYDSRSVCMCAFPFHFGRVDDSIGRVDNFVGQVHGMGFIFSVLIGIN